MTPLFFGGGSLTSSAFLPASDKRSSLDSLQQALFFSVLTGKRPTVVIYDTDGQEGRFEYRIRTACQKAGVRYEVFR